MFRCGWISPKMRMARASRASAFAASTWPSISPVPAAVVTDIERLAAAGVNTVVGTTGWTEQMDRAKAAVEKGGIGLVWSPNFSIGVNIFLHLVAEASRQSAPYQEYGAWAWEIHHVHEKGCAQRHVAENGGRDEKGRSQSARGRKLQPRRRASRHARNRLRFGGRYHHAAAHRAQPRRFRARCAQRGAKWVIGKKGWFEFRDVLFD